MKIIKQVEIKSLTLQLDSPEEVVNFMVLLEAADTYMVDRTLQEENRRIWGNPGNPGKSFYQDKITLSYDIRKQINEAKA